jgi:hypothetical protein
MGDLVFDTKFNRKYFLENIALIQFDIYVVSVSVL